MEDNLSTSDLLLAATYREYSTAVYHYFFRRLNGADDDAKDLTQDVFLRLMTYRHLLRPATAKSLVFTIASRLLIDHLRRLSYRRAFASALRVGYDEASPVDASHRTVCGELVSAERRAMRLLPPQRRKIYVLTRFGEHSAGEIATRLSLSVRTVENHLRLGRKQVREYMRRCI